MIRGFASPAALALAAFAIPILITYMLKPRRPRWTLSSTFLWEPALDNVAASTPWQRLRPSILLALQMLLLAGLVIGVARPYMLGEGIAGSHLILVVDASGSMQATDHAPSRIDEAKRQARDLIDNLPASGRISVVAASSSPRVLASATTDRRAATRAIDSIRAFDAPADFGEAFLLAESLESPGDPATIAILSDGGLTTEDEKLLPSGAVFREIGRSEQNIAISQVSVEESAAGFKALVSVKNFGTKPATTMLSLELNDAPLTSFPMKVPASRTVERTVDLGPEEGRLVARIDSSDPLAADDRAFAFLGRTRATRIALVTPGNLFLEKVLQQIPGSRVDVTSSAPAADGYDLAVFDRVPIPQKVPWPSLFVAPSTPPAGVRLAGKIASPVVDSIAVDPILKDVDLSDLAVAEMISAELPDSKVLVGASDAPLVAVWEEGPLRRGWIAFDLHQSNFALQVAFPILMDHLVGWLSGGVLEEARFAGDPIRVSAPAGVTRVAVEAPGATGASIEPGGTFETAEAGFYRLRYMAGDDEVDSATIGLSFPGRESAIAPRSLVTPDAGARPGLTARARKQLTTAVVAIALLLAVLEWWWAFGRPKIMRST